MSNEVVLVTRKDIIEIANKTIDSQVGTFKRDVIAQAVIEEVGKKNVSFLLDEFVNSCVTSVFNSRAKPKGKISGQSEFNWGQYANQLIKLEGSEGVLIRYAETKHLRTRRENITDNAIKISAAAYEDTQRIDKLIKTIDANKLTNAGDAMRFLGYDIDSSSKSSDDTEDHESED